MTTIAVSQEMVAADTLMTDGSTIASTIKKIQRVPDGIAGYAGSVTDGYKFMQWLNGYFDDEKPELEDFEGILLTNKGNIISFESDLTPIQHNDKFYALGSGKQAALAAMHLGEDPKGAVKIAMKVDVFTGGKVKAICIK
jgi:ATP-dependent protease HslVU (ClpYQ) peptidase subunit